MQKKRNTSKIWLVSLGSIIFLLALIALAANIVLRTYLGSEAFRSLVATKTGEALGGGTAVYAQLDWTATDSAFSQHLDYSGLGTVASLRANGIRAALDWRAAFSGQWRIPTIEIQNSEIILRTDFSAKNSEISNPSYGITPQPHNLATSAKNILGLPTKFNIERITSLHTRLEWQHSSYPGTISDVCVVATPDGNKDWKFCATGGAAQIEGLPRIDCDTLSMRTGKNSIHLLDATFRSGSNGRISATGSIVESLQDWTIKYQGVECADWLPADWKSHLSGILSGTVHITRPATSQDWTLQGQALLRDGILERLPILDSIADFTSSQQFRKIPLNELSGDFTRDTRGWTIENFLCESRGLLRIEGSIYIAHDRAIKGTLRIGVAAQTLRWLPGSQERVFTKNEGGYAWTDLLIGGTLDKISEDLSPRLAAAAAGKVIDTGVRIIQGADETVKEGVKSLLDIIIKP